MLESAAVFRDKTISRDEFIFYSKRLMRLLIEFALSLLPFKVGHMTTGELGVTVTMWSGDWV